MTNKTTKAARAEAAAPQPGPTSPPPGGGRWKWDGETQQWVSLDQPNNTPTQE